MKSIDSKILAACLLIIISLISSKLNAQCPEGYIKVYKPLDTIVAPCIVIVQPVEEEASQRITIKEQEIKLDQYKKLLPQKIQVSDSLKGLIQNYKAAYEKHNFEIQRIRDHEKLLIKSYSEQLISCQNSQYKLKKNVKRKNKVIMVLVPLSILAILLAL